MSIEGAERREYTERLRSGGDDGSPARVCFEGIALVMVWPIRPGYGALPGKLIAAVARPDLAARVPLGHARLDAQQRLAMQLADARLGDFENLPDFSKIEFVVVV